MVEQKQRLDLIFRSLSDPTRRDMLQRISKRGKSVSDIAAHYDLSFAGVAKHLQVLEHAGLVHKSRRGKEQIVALSPKALAMASAYLDRYRALWEQRLDSLDSFLSSTHKQ